MVFENVLVADKHKNLVGTRTRRLANRDATRCRAIRPAAGTCLCRKPGSRAARLPSGARVADQAVVWRHEPGSRSAADCATEKTTGPNHATGVSVPAVVFEHVCLAFDDDVVLRDISFSVPAGHMTIVIGASGSGKSVALKLILGLLKPDAGIIRVNGERIDTMTEDELMRVRDDIGMLFQENALFDADRCERRGITRSSKKRTCRRTRSVVASRRSLGSSGWRSIDRMPSELWVASAGGLPSRAIAARPRLLLFDEPTSGLDPITAKTVDAEVIKLRTSRT